MKLYMIVTGILLLTVCLAIPSEAELGYLNVSVSAETSGLAIEGATVSNNQEETPLANVTGPGGTCVVRYNLTYEPGATAILTVVADGYTKITEKSFAIGPQGVFIHMARSSAPFLSFAGIVASLLGICVVVGIVRARSLP